MSDLWEQVKAFYEADEWPMMPREDARVLQSSFKGHSGQWMIVVRVMEEQGYILFYSVAPVRVMEHRREEAMEFITRANYGLYVGNFEIDLADGEVRYKTSVDTEGFDGPVTSFIRQISYANVSMMDRYLPGLLAICYGNMSAQEAIQMVEQPKQAQN